MKEPLAVWVTDTHLSEKSLPINFSIFQQAFSLCDDLGTKTLIHGGDIFESRKAQSELVLTSFKKILEDAASKNIKILAIPGNHDKTDYTSESSFLDAFDGHAALAVTPSVLSGDHIDIYFLPYFDEKLSYSAHLKNIIDSVDPKRISILCTHIGIADAKTNSGTILESNINASWFKDFTYVLVGHYHDQYFIGNNIVYTGSTHQANFGENDKKGAWIIYDTNEPKEVLEFVQFDFPKYITLDILPSDLTIELIEQVKEKQSEANIRLRVQGSIEESQYALVAELQQCGSKVEIEKNEYAHVAVKNSENTSLNANDILSFYSDWIKDRKIKNHSYGKQILQQYVEY